MVFFIFGISISIVNVLIIVETNNIIQVFASFASYMSSVRYVSYAKYIVYTISKIEFF